MPSAKHLPSPPDPRPSKAHPEERAHRKELEKKHPAFGWKQGLILGLMGVTIFMNIERDVEKREKKHQEKDDDKNNGRDGEKKKKTKQRDDRDRDWDRDSNGRGRARRRSWDNSTSGGGGGNPYYYSDGADMRGASTASRWREAGRGEREDEYRERSRRRSEGYYRW